MKEVLSRNGKEKGRRRIIDGKSWWAWFFAGPGPCQINAMKVEQGWCGQIVDRVLLLQEHGGMREEGKKIHCDFARVQEAF